MSGLLLVQWVGLEVKICIRLYVTQWYQTDVGGVYQFTGNRFVFGPKKEEITRDWIELHDEKF